MNQRFHATTGLVFALLFTGVPQLLAQGKNVSGAIFTTLGDGTAVNANIYQSKCAVYLDGGPGPNAPAGAAGLPDGDYYFQVTDPSGKQLLSTDAVSNRRFAVSHGVITAYIGYGGPVHPTGIDRDHPELGATTIRLANAMCPDDYLDSPNNGGTYKVWATPVSEFVGDPAKVDNECGNGCYHGFIPSKSKTDNFKAKTGTPTFCLTIEKQFEETQGTFTPRANWQMEVTDPLLVTNTYFTGSNGQVRICGLDEGTYTVTENLPQDGTVVGLIVNGQSLTPEPVYSFAWTSKKPEPIIVLQNTRLALPE
jgi:hypothetical protein